jgi:hypothetical protein
VLHSERSAWDESEEDNRLEGEDEYSLIRCKGCDTVHLRHEYWVTGDYDDRGEPKVHWVFYPRALSRRKPPWLSSFDSPFWYGGTFIEKILKEIYSALQNGSISLATIGVRALIEHIMIEKCGDSGTISGNIEAFFAAGHVSAADQPAFRDKLMEIGNATMHRGFEPTQSDLETLLDMTESLIASIYVHPLRVQNLRAVPPRPPRQKATKNE